MINRGWQGPNIAAEEAGEPVLGALTCIAPVPMGSTWEGKRKGSMSGALS